MRDTSDENQETFMYLYVTPHLEIALVTDDDPCEWSGGVLLGFTLHRLRAFLLPFLLCRAILLSYRSWFSRSLTHQAYICLKEA